MRLLNAVLGFSFSAALTMHAAGLMPGPVLSAAPSQYVASDGTRIHYKVVGRGRPTIVFLHGLGGDMNVWREQVAALHTRARLILIDLPGHGDSEAPASYSMRGLARAVNAVLKQTNTDRAILVGHSIGALIAREVDRTYPGHCRAVVSVDGMLRNPFPEPEAAAKALASFQGPDGDAHLGAFYDSMLSAASPSLRDEVRTAALATPRAAVVGTLQATILPDAWKDDDKLSVPLYAVMAKSPYTNDDYLQYVRGLGKDVTIDVIDGTDHYLMLDAAQELNRRLETWLEAHKWLK